MFATQENNVLLIRVNNYLGGKGKCDAIAFYLVGFASICFFAVETMWV